MTANELAEIFRAIDVGTLTRAQAMAALVAKGAHRDDANEMLALHLGESEGDVLN